MNTELTLIQGVIVTASLIELLRVRAQEMQHRSGRIADDQNCHRSQHIHTFQQDQEHPIMKRRKKQMNLTFPSIRGAQARDLDECRAVTPVRDEFQFPRNGIIPPPGYVGHARGVGRPSIFRGHGIANISGNVATPYIWRK